MLRISAKRIHNFNGKIFGNSLTLKGHALYPASFGSDLTRCVMARFNDSTMSEIEDAIHNNNSYELFLPEHRKGWFAKEDMPLVKDRIKLIVSRGHEIFGDAWNDDECRDLPNENDIEGYIDFWMAEFTSYRFNDLYTDMENLVNMDRQTLWSFGNYPTSKRYRVSRKTRILNEMAEIISCW